MIKALTYGYLVFALTTCIGWDVGIPSEHALIGGAIMGFITFILKLATNHQDPTTNEPA